MYGGSGCWSITQKWCSVSGRKSDLGEWGEPAGHPKWKWLVSGTKNSDSGRLQFHNEPLCSKITNGRDFSTLTKLGKRVQCCLVLKMVFNFAHKPTPISPALLSDLKQGETGVLGEFDLPEAVADQLMNLGMVPGLEVTVAGSGPGGDPRIYRVDGTEVALRSELARRMGVRPVENSSFSTAAQKRATKKEPVLALGAQEASAD
jgi:Fe2+ transport system protein FeoA